MPLTPSRMTELQSPLPTFRLPDAEGRLVGSEGYPNQPLLVIFMCNHCPFVKHLADALADFAREYQARGLAVVGINSNDFQAHPEDRPERMVEEARARGYTFPYLSTRPRTWHEPSMRPAPRTSSCSIADTSSPIAASSMTAVRATIHR